MKLFFVLLFSALLASAADVRFQWDANSEPNVSYRLYWGGASRSYTNSVTSTNTTATISNVVASATYFVAVTARDTNGLESAYSEEVSFVLPRPPARLRLSVNIQSALNLGEQWEDGPQFVTFEFPAAEQRFYRASVAARME